LLSILLGLTSAITWGAGDFTGGMASRKTGAYRAVFYGELVGLSLLIIAELWQSQLLPDIRSMIFAFIAGALGTIGILFLYTAMSRGKMSIAAPVSALLSAALPVVVGIFTDGWPKAIVFAGFAFAFAAVWLVSQSEEAGIKDLRTHLVDLKLPLLAGAGFACYFVFMHLATHDSVIWPMIIARASGWFVIAAFMLIRRESFASVSGAWPLILLNGVLDVGGNFFYVLAGQIGRLDISAVLSSLFPGATVLLAWVILKERLTRTQWLGILAALIAIVLFTV
jgi:drug/metabolite transporter (DMT)-like permease